MITIYNQNETEFNTNGLAVLEPSSCVLSVALNGSWYLELEHPFDKFEKYQHIQKDRIIKIDKIPVVLEQVSTYQLFRIYDTVNTLKSVKAVAFPVAFEAIYDAIIEELKTTSKTATATLSDISSYLSSHGVTKYTIESDYSMVTNPKSKKGNFVNTNLIAAISGSDDGSIINKWGGEVAYDNYKLIVNGRLGKIGTQTGYYEVRYGKNLTGLSVDTDVSGVVTRLYPISADEVRLVYTPSGAQDSQSYVDSPLIVAPNTNPYPYIRSAFIETDYTLIDTSYDASKPNSNTAIATHGVQTAITEAIHTVMSDMWTDMLGGTAYPHTASGKWYEPEWIQDNIDDVVKTLQTELLTTWNITHPSFKNLVQTCIKDGISWIKKEDLGEDYWEQVNDAWQYVHAGRTIKNQYFYIDRRYCYFNVSGTYEPQKDVKSMNWIQGKTSRAKKKYGNNQRYYAQNETVYTMGDDGEGNRQFNEYYFDSDGWWDGVSNTASSWNWYQSGNKWWFGEEGATSDDENKFAHDTWLFIKSSDDATTDGGKPTLYYFDSDGYMDSTLSIVDCGWDWREKENRDYFGSTNKTQRAVYITNQYLKVDGEWKKFGSDSYVVKNETLKTQLTTVLKNAINTALGGTGGTIETQSNILYNLLYEQMVSYCLDRFADGVDKPAVNIQIDTLDLMKTKGYEDIVQITPTPAGYWNCDDEWKTTDFTIAWEAPQWHDRYWKWNYGLACGCIGRYYYDGNLVYGWVSLSGNGDDCATSSNGKFGAKGTIHEVEIEGQTFYRSTDLHTIYPLMVSEGSLKELDFYATHGRYASSFDEFFQYFLKVSHFTTQKKDLSGIHLGDDVNVIDYEHGYDIKERCVALKYDCIRGYNTEITIDKLAKNLSQILGTTNLGSSDGSNRLIAGEGVTITNGVIEVHTDSGNTYNGSQVSVDAIATGGQKIADIYIDGTPHPIYGDGGTQYTAGTNVQISEQNVISATDTTYNDFAGSTHGLVPSVSTQTGKYLKDDGSWDEPEGTAVEANPSGTATDTLSTILIDDTIYEIEGGGGGGEIVTSIIENGNNFAFLYTEHDIVAYSYPVVSFSAYSSFVEGTDHGIAIYKLAIPKEIKKIRYSVYLMADYATSQSDNYKFCVGVKSTLDTTNYTNPTDNDFIAKNLHSFTREGDTITGELAVESSTDFYIYIIANGWHCTLSSLQLVRYSGGGASSLEELEDVDITNPSNGQTISYNSTSGKWENTTPSGGGSLTAVKLNTTQYNALSQEQKEDSTKLYLINDNGTYDVETTLSVSDYYELYQGAMTISTSTALNTITYAWNGGSYIGAQSVYKNKIPRTAKKIKYKITTGSTSYSNTNERFKICVGLKSNYDIVNYSAPNDQDWIVKTESFATYNSTFEGELDLSAVYQDTYLYVEGHGWNMTIEYIKVVEEQELYGTSIKYLDDDYTKNNLSDLFDASISNPTDGQTIKYDATLGKWKNASGGGGGGGSISIEKIYESNTYSATVILDSGKSLFDYDAIQIVAIWDVNASTHYEIQNLFLTQDSYFADGYTLGMAEDSRYLYSIIEQNGTQLRAVARNGYYIVGIYGISF